LSRAPQKKPNLADVAAAADLSPAAASLALHGKPGVSDATRERVLEAAARLGYLPPSTMSGRTRDPVTVTLVIRALPEARPAANVFYGPILSGIEERCRGLNIRLMFATMPVDEHNHPLYVPPSVAERRTDGLIIVGADFGRGTAPLLGAGKLPAVLVDGYAEDDALHSVDIDNVYGARAAVRYLLDRGHREIALVGTAPDAYPSVRERRVGYQQVLAEAGLTPHYVDVPYYDHEQAASAAVQYVLAHHEVSAIFCANDLVAITFVQLARAAGISIPDRISVVGFDDIDLAAMITPSLTTMAVDKIGMGRLAVTLLLHQLEMERSCATTTLIKPTLVERETVVTAPPVRDAVEAGPRP
jgi:DNA-binding LacI/PurR family transcriptional regulator